MTSAERAATLGADVVRTIGRVAAVAALAGTPTTIRGVAHLRGKTNAERAEALIAIADPAFREQLGEQAQEMHLL